MSNKTCNTGAAAGVGTGSVIAGLISWEHTQSIMWTFLHIVFGWFYVIYSLIVKRVHF